MCNPRPRRMNSFWCFPTQLKGNLEVTLFLASIATKLVCDFGAQPDVLPMLTHTRDALRLVF